MNSRVTKMAYPEPVRSGTYQGKKRPAMLSLKEATEKTGDNIILLVPATPVHWKVQATSYPMTPRTPDLDVDDGSESPGSSQSSSKSSMFTFNLLSPHQGYGFSFTVCPSSPLDESMVGALSPGKRPNPTSFPMGSRKFSVDHSDLPIVFDSPQFEDPLGEGLQSPSDDRKYFHVQFLQEDSPFPRTPDC